LFRPIQGCVVSYGNAKFYYAFNNGRQTNGRPDPQVVGIIRDVTMLGTIFEIGDVILPWDASPTGSYVQGLQLTGAPGMKQKTAYADDPFAPGFFDFTGLTMEANYYDGATLPISFADIDYRIIPDYDRKNADGSYKGWVFITVGRNYGNWIGLNAAGQDVKTNCFNPATGTSDPVGTGWNDQGITVPAALDVVYTVKEIAFTEDPGLPNFFYWQANTYNAWATRLVNKSLKVTYEGGAAPKTFGVAELMSARKMWCNPNPPAGQAPGPDYDFDIIPVATPFTKATGMNPRIQLYYRGAFLDVPVDVYTQLVSASAVGKDGDLFHTHSDNPRDNDIELGGQLGALAAKMAVTATYQAYNDSSKTADATLQYLALPDARNGTGAYFTMLQGDYDTIVQNAKNDGKVKSITVTHRMNALNGINAQQKTNKPNVTWALN
jgi:hypothetical protein